VNPYIVSPHAADDLNGIWEYLAIEAGEELADRTLAQLASAFSALADHPGIGHSRADLTSLPVHFHYIRPYMVIYQRDRSPLAIHAVLHSARDLRRILHARPL
jgi:plasmid stabilization system protein ParE